MTEENITTIDVPYTFEEYSEQASAMAISPGNIQPKYAYYALALGEEAGEVQGKVKKLIRDSGGILTDEIKRSITKEMGDALWYLNQLAIELGIRLVDVAQMNICNLRGRQERGTLQGSGDDR